MTGRARFKERDGRAFFLAAGAALLLKVMPGLQVLLINMHFCMEGKPDSLRWSWPMTMSMAERPMTSLFCCIPAQSPVSFDLSSCAIPISSGIW